MRISLMNVVIKYVLVVSNCILFIGGIGLLVLGALTFNIDKILNIIPNVNSLSQTTYIIIITGSIIVIVSFLGCCGSLFERKWMIGLYIIIMLLLTIFLMIGDGMRFFGRMHLGENIRSFLNDSLENTYGMAGKEIYTNFWDEMQSKFHCCGVDEVTKPESYDFWQTSKWYSEILKNHTNINFPKIQSISNTTGLWNKGLTKPRDQIKTWFEKMAIQLPQKVPDSCCSKDINETLRYDCVRLKELGNAHLFKEGCFRKIFSLIEGNIFSNLSLIILFFMVISIILGVLYLQDL
ncbi:unnamed protein product [Gordionus sp. m RMFG-2023]